MFSIASYIRANWFVDLGFVRPQKILGGNKIDKPAHFAQKHGESKQNDVVVYNGQVLCQFLVIEIVDLQKVQQYSHLLSQ